MNAVLIAGCIVGVLLPVVVVLAASGNPLLSALSALAALLIEILVVVLWLDTRSERKALDRRLRRVAAPLSGDAPTDGEGSVEISVFRQRRAKSWLFDTIQSRFSMLEVDKALPKALGLGGLAALVICLAAAFIQYGLVSVLLLAPVSWLGASWAVLALQDAGRRTEFLRLFPEAVDHVVRLMRAGLPSAEAISVVAEEAQPPISGVLGGIAEGISAGLDPETVIRSTATYIRIPEFTLFSAAVCLQRTTGGVISGALGNLSAMLRTRRETALKARSATAQTRLTLTVVASIPVVVLALQKFSNPQAVEMLFYTESGATLLRYGTGCIIAGLLVARGLASRVAR